MYVPAGQVLQLLEPSAVLYVPPVQVVHELRPEEEVKEPAEQSTQELPVVYIPAGHAENEQTTMFDREHGTSFQLFPDSTHSSRPP